MPRFQIYSRKSIYTGRGDSIENQIELCKAYIMEHYPETQQTDISIFEDEGFSGKNINRPQFRRMLASVERGDADYVICYRLDRISRNVKDFSELMALLQAKKTGFICIKEEFDTKTPMGRAMMYIASIFAQLERETIGERVKDHFYLLARTGRWLGGPRPTGFLPVEETSFAHLKERRAYRLVPVETELQMVKQAYATFLESASLNGTVSQLNQQGWLTKQALPFTVSSLKSILRNPVYAKATPEVYGYFLRRGSDLAFDQKDCNGQSGLMTYNRSTMEKTKKVLRDYSEWIVSIGLHDGVIEGRQWVQIQELLDDKATKFAGRSVKKHTALLVGLIRCRRCGAPMKVILGAKPKKDGNRPMRYVCAQPRNNSCEMPGVDAYALDELIWHTLLQFPNLDAQIRSGISSLRAMLDKAQAQQHSESSCAIRTNEINARISSLVATLADGGIDTRMIGQIKEQIAHCQKEKASMPGILSYEDAAEQGLYRNERLHNAKVWPEQFSQLLENAAKEQTQMLLRAVIERIEWDGSNAHIFLVGE